MVLPAVTFSCDFMYLSIPKVSYTFITLFTGYVITYPWWDWISSTLVKGAPGSRGLNLLTSVSPHDDVIKWKLFPCYWPFVRGIHRSPMNSPQKGQWRGALMFSLICTWTNGWVSNRDDDDFWRHRAHYDVTVISGFNVLPLCLSNKKGTLFSLRAGRFKGATLDGITAIIASFKMAATQSGE